MAHVHGRFERFEGGIQVTQDIADSRVHVRIDASSITTGNNTRDAHLRSADFLDVENFPYIDFRSTRFAYRGGSKWTLYGTLTMHGISRREAFLVAPAACARPAHDCDVVAQGRVLRTDYGVESWRWALTDDVSFRLRVRVLDTPPSVSAP